MKYFYEEITQLTIVTHKTFGPTADKKEVEKMMDIIKSTIHHKVLDHILSELDDSLREEFIHILAKNESHKSTLEKLKQHIKDIEEKVKDVVKKAEQEIYTIITSTTT